jgi:glycogen phosphorylase
MATKQKTAPAAPAGSDGLAKLRRQYGCGPIAFSGTDDALYERHLLFDDVVSPAAAGPRERFEAVARSVWNHVTQPVG